MSFYVSMQSNPILYLFTIVYFTCLPLYSPQVYMKWALGDMLFRQRKHTNSFADTILYVITFGGCTNNRWKGDLSQYLFMLEI